MPDAGIAEILGPLLFAGEDVAAGAAAGVGAGEAAGGAALGLGAGEAAGAGALGAGAAGLGGAAALDSGLAVPGALGAAEGLGAGAAGAGFDLAGAADTGGLLGEGLGVTPQAASSFDLLSAPGVGSGLAPGGGLSAAGISPDIAGAAPLGEAASTQPGYFSQFLSSINPVSSANAADLGASTSGAGALDSGLGVPGATELPLAPNTVQGIPLGGSPNIDAASLGYPPGQLPGDTFAQNGWISAPTSPTPGVPPQGAPSVDFIGANQTPVPQGGGPDAVAQAASQSTAGASNPAAVAGGSPDAAAQAASLTPPSSPTGASQGALTSIGGGGPDTAAGTAAGAPAAKSGLDKMMSNPGLLAALGIGGVGLLGSSLFKPSVPGSDALNNLAAQSNQFQQAELGLQNQLTQPLLTGQLPSGQQAIVDRAVQDAKNTVKARYASMGLGNSTALQEQLAYIDQNSTAIAGQLEQQMAQTGQQAATTAASAMGLQGQIYTSLMNATIQQDTALRNSIASFAGQAGIATAIGSRA